MKRTIEEREDMGIKEVNSFYDKEESKLYNYNVNTKPHKTIKHNKNNHKPRGDNWQRLRQQRSRYNN